MAAPSYGAICSLIFILITYACGSYALDDDLVPSNLSASPTNGSLQSKQDRGADAKEKLSPERKALDGSNSDEGKEGSKSEQQIQRPVPLNPEANKATSKLSELGQSSTHKASFDYDKAGEDVVHLVKDGREFADNTLGFWHAFVASLSVIIVSELGDKTWFIAAILAMRHSRSTVFAGALAALAVMTVLSASLGWATQIIPRKVTFYVSTALFALFGLKMLKEGYDMSPDEGQEEYAEAENEVKKKEDEMARQYESERMIDVEKGPIEAETRFSMGRVLKFVSAIFLESFTLTFLAEWGDRSQITTIILAAREDVAGVAMGGTLGHAVCTGIAVVGGRLVAQRISVRTVTLIGGVVFIVFALSALFLSPE